MAENPPVLYPLYIRIGVVGNTTKGVNVSISSDGRVKSTDTIKIAVEV